MNGFSSLDEDELRNILEGKDSINTKRVVRASVAVLESHDASKNIDLIAVAGQSVFD